MCVRRVVSVITLLGLVGAVRGQPAQPLDGEAIAAIWKERQDKIQTAAFEMTRHLFEPKGAMNKYNPYYIHIWRKKISNFGDGPIPPKDLRMSSKCRLLLDGVKVRHDYFMEELNPHTLEYYHRKEWGAFDGRHFRNITGRLNGEEQGDVRKAKFYPEASLVAVSSLLTTVRGRTRGLTMVDPRLFQTTGRRTRIDGVDCLEYLVGKEPDGSFSRHVWLAPSQGWLVVRDIQYTTKSDTVDKKEIRYKPDPTVGWVPASWEYARTKRGELLLQYRFELVSHTFNTPIDPGEFVLKFPKGMNVMDEDGRGSGAVVGIVQEDGLLLPNDGRPAYYLPGTTEPVWRKGLRYGLYALIAATVGALLWRAIRRYRRAATIPPTAPSPSGGPS